MFRIKSINFFNHYKFGNLNFNFSDNQNGVDYFTILIGPNGTGKSLLLEIIIIIFKTIAEDQKKAFSKIDFNFEINYFINGKLYYYKKEDELTETNIKSWKDLPRKIIANTFSANDRFPFIDKRRNLETENHFELAYEYQGLRTIANAIYKGTNLKRLLYSLLSISQKIEKLENLQVLFDNVQFERQINFTLKAGKELKIKHNNKKIYDFIGNLDSFKLYFNDLISKKYSTYSSKKNRYNYLKKYLNDEKVLLQSSIFLQKLLISNEFSINKKNDLRYVLNFDDLNSFKEIKKFAYSIELLTELDIIDITNISFIKDKSELGLYNMSSGEFNILSSIINIASKIEDNSLIIIDEPEISLHPEWQMKYINILKMSFEKFENIHFFISTHSHFILSDLFPSNSKIIALKKDTNGTKIKYINESTYAKSAEEILLEIFETPTTRNYYVTELVGTILEKMADPTVKDELIKNEIKKLKSLNLDLLSNADPLKDVINKLVSKLT